MLNRVAMLLKMEEKNTPQAVPALKDFIKEFISREDELYKLILGKAGGVTLQTLEKTIAKEAFAKTTLKLLRVRWAADYKNKKKKSDEKKYTLWGLKKLSAAKLCAVYNAAMRDIQKIE